jgi:hypothetical protein
MISDLEPGEYWVHSWSSAGQDVRGQYFSELLYEIEVNTREPKSKHGRLTVTRPAEFEGAAAEMVRKMVADGLLTEPELQRFKSIQSRTRTDLGQKARDPYPPFP